MTTDRTTAALERDLRAMGADTEEPAAASAARLAERAAAEELLDVAYGSTDSPVGPLLLASTPRGLVKVAFASGGTDEVLEQLSSQLSPRVLEAPRKLDDVRRELDEYFDGTRRTFNLPLDRRLSRGFRLAAPQYRLLSTFGDFILFKGSLAEVVAEGRFDRDWKTPPDRASLMTATGAVTVRQ